MTSEAVINADRIDGVIFDLDGVITKTADVHAAAWARLFNDYLEERTGGSFDPFTEDDYLRYVDGKPRYDGVASFLRSRGIDLPRGTPDDHPDTETVCGLGNRKNGYFLDHVATHGVEPYATSVEFVRDLQHQGTRTALISSSRNVMPVLDAAGLSDLFPVIIDGLVAAEIGIPGKPDPAVFLEAAARIGVEPTRAAIVEDALSGVQAGAAGGFHVVIGVDRADHADALAANGATITVSDLGEVEVHAPTPVPRDDLEAAIANATLAARLGDREPAIFLDYDGALTPIVEHPDLALLSEETRAVVARLATHRTVAIVSGRDVNDVADKVDVPGIYYAGSHGFDIIGPDGQPARGDDDLDFGSYLPSLEQASTMLEDRLEGVHGSQVERKKFAIAVHYRRVAQRDRARVEQAVRDVAPQFDDLRLSTGKMVFELRPDIEWDKGRALLWLLRRLDLDRADIVPVYIGDDTTDEDAFRVVRTRGAGIVVGTDGGPTLARWSLADTDETRELLASFIPEGSAR